jgi:hypothetical protein
MSEAVKRIFATKEIPVWSWMFYESGLFEFIKLLFFKKFIKDFNKINNKKHKLNAIVIFKEVSWTGMIP